MKSKAYATVFITLFVTLGVVGFIDTAAADNDRDHDEGYDGNKGSPIAKTEIEELMSCYAYSFDSIARATHVPIDTTKPPDLVTDFSTWDPNYAEGLKRFRRCTTWNWYVEFFGLDGTPLLSKGEIPPGALPFVNLVTYLARLNGQTNSQHLFGSLSTTVHRKKGTLKAYAIITTFDGTGETTGTSTYTSDVVYRRGKWLLKKTSVIVN